MRNHALRNAVSVLLFTFASTSVVAAEYENLGTVFLHAGSRCPSWSMEAAGQILPIANNQYLYSMIGTLYGGDGRQTFGLPDLRGEGPISSNGRVMRYCILTNLEQESSAATDTTGNDDDRDNEVVRGRRRTISPQEDDVEVQQDRTTRDHRR